MTGFAVHANTPTPRILPHTPKHAVVCAPRELLGAYVGAFTKRRLSVDGFATDASLMHDALHRAIDRADFSLICIGQHLVMEQVLFKTQRIRRKDNTPALKWGLVCLSDDTGHIAPLVVSEELPFLALLHSEPEKLFPRTSRRHFMVETDPTRIVNAFLGSHV